MFLAVRVRVRIPPIRCFLSNTSHDTTRAHEPSHVSTFSCFLSLEIGNCVSSNISVSAAAIETSSKALSPSAIGNANVHWMGWGSDGGWTKQLRRNIRGEYKPRIIRRPLIEAQFSAHRKVAPKAVGREKAFQEYRAFAPMTVSRRAAYTHRCVRCAANACVTALFGSLLTSGSRDIPNDDERAEKKTPRIKHNKEENITRASEKC